MGGLCFKEQLTLEETPVVQLNEQLEKPQPIIEVLVKAKPSTKKRRKGRVQVVGVVNTSPVQKVPQRITAIEETAPNLVDTVSEYEELKKKTMKLFIKSTGSKKAKASQKKSKKNNLLKTREKDLAKKEKLVIPERKNSPTTTSDCSEKLELKHDIDLYDYLGDGETEMTENSICFLEDKEESIHESIVCEEIQEQKDKRKNCTEEKPFFPFMRKLHCEIAFTARAANAYCEELLPTCNKIQAYIDSILHSIDSSKFMY